jgi:hypothetical protein
VACRGTKFANRSCSDDCVRAANTRGLVFTANCHKSALLSHFAGTLIPRNGQFAKKMSSKSLQCYKNLIFSLLNGIRVFTMYSVNVGNPDQDLI